MWRRALQVAAVLLCLHAALTFGFALLVFPGAPFERMAFAQHGFNFVFLALLNLALLRPISPALRAAVLAADVIFFVNNVIFAFIKPEPPTVTAAVITGIAASAAIGLIRATPRAA